MWNAQPSPSSPSTDNCLGCLTGHGDYITSIAVSASSKLLASAGLRSELFIWDVEKLAAIGRVDGLSGSLYSLAADSRGGVLAAGSTDGSIVLVDPRSGRCVALLKGHTDVVKAVKISPNGDVCISGSADHTVKLWDIRQHRTLHTSAAHTDSVWTLAVDPDFTTVLTGGRDRCVYQTHLATRVTELIVEEQAPVQALAASPSFDWIWVGTTSSTVRRWKIDSDHLQHSTLPSPSPPRGVLVGNGPSASHRAFLAATMPASRSRMVFSRGDKPEAQQQEPEYTLKGVSPITQAAALTDRRHVLTQDSDGRVQLWDVINGAVVRDLGKSTTLKEAEKELFDPAHNVAPWFSPDTRLGSLAGQMEPPGCFLAEAYRRDLGDPNAAADARVNMGERMLRALFKDWAGRRHAEPGSHHRSALGTTGNIPSTAKISSQPGSPEGTIPDPSSPGSNAAADSSPPSPSSAFEFHMRGRSPVVMISGDDHYPPFRRAADAFTGEEQETEIVPQWVADCVLRGQYVAGKELKMAFVLVPAENSGLPSLMQSRLSAPRVLGVDKVADYVLRKMSDQGIVMKEEPLFWAPEKQAQWDAEHGTASSGQQQQPEEEEPQRGGLLGIRQLRPMLSSQNAASQQERPLLITCNGVAVPWDFSLAAVRQWVWKKPDDLRLEFGFKESGTKLRPPVIRPPS